MPNLREMVAFWLLPRAGERVVLSRLVRDLAGRFDAPPFDPHVTLFAGPMTSARAKRVLATLSAHGPLRLEIERVEISQEFTKTLFLQFRPSLEAAEVSAAIAAEGGYRFDPHLSLLYATLPETTKADVARTIELPFTSVTFDALRTIVCPAQIRRRADVEAWRTLEERAL